MTKEEMTSEEAIEVLKQTEFYARPFDNSVEASTKAYRIHKAIYMAIKALEQEPYEKFESIKDHICKLAGDYKCWDNRLAPDEALELCRILEQQPCVDAVSRSEVDRLCYRYLKVATDEHVAFYEDFLDLPSVTPTRKKGRWIYTPHKRLVDETDEGRVYEVQEKCSCSACGADFGYCKVEDSFCKYCGAEMGGSGECE